MKHGQYLPGEIWTFLKGVSLPAVAVAFLALAAPVAAAPLAILSHPSEIVTVQAAEVEASASYTVVDEHFELKMTFTEADGSTLNTRIMLVDGQRYAVAFEGDAAGVKGAYFAFRRNGQSIELTTDPRREPTTLASR